MTTNLTTENLDTVCCRGRKQLNRFAIINLMVLLINTALWIYAGMKRYPEDLIWYLRPDFITMFIFFGSFIFRMICVAWSLIRDEDKLMYAGMNSMKNDWSRTFLTQIILGLVLPAIILIHVNKSAPETAVLPLIATLLAALFNVLTWSVIIRRIDDSWKKHTG